MSSLNRIADHDGPSLRLRVASAWARFWCSPVLRNRFGHFGAFLQRADALLPRGIGTIATLALMISGLGYGMHVGGSSGAFAGGAARIIGLSATDIVIAGQVETPEKDILAALGIAETGSLVGIDAETARARILDLPWVEKVTIRKLYPGRLLVGVREKKPHALWQVGERLSVVDSNGALIAPVGAVNELPPRWEHMPLLVGRGAAGHAAQIIALLEPYPSLAGRVRAYIRVTNRRWDLALGNGMRIKLPEADPAKAIELLADLDGHHRLLSRQVDIVDLRQEKRVVMRLQADAAAARAEAVLAREKAMKEADRTL